MNKYFFSHKLLFVTCLLLFGQLLFAQKSKTSINSIDTYQGILELLEKDSLVNEKVNLLSGKKRRQKNIFFKVEPIKINNKNIIYDYRLLNLNTKQRLKSPFSIYFFTKKNNSVEFKIFKNKRYDEREIYFEGDYRVQGEVNKDSITNLRYIIPGFIGSHDEYFITPKKDSLLKLSYFILKHEEVLLSNVTKYSELKKMENYKIFSISEKNIVNIHLSDYLLEHNLNIHFVLLEDNNNQHLVCINTINNEQYIYRLHGFKKNDVFKFYDSIIEKSIVPYQEFDKELLNSLIGDKKISELIYYILIDNNLL